MIIRQEQLNKNPFLCNLSTLLFAAPARPERHKRAGWPEESRLCVSKGTRLGGKLRGNEVWLCREAYFEQPPQCLQSLGGFSPAAGEGSPRGSGSHRRARDYGVIVTGIMTPRPREPLQSCSLRHGLQDPRGTCRRGVTCTGAVLSAGHVPLYLPPRSTWPAVFEHTGLGLWLQGDGYLLGQGLGMLPVMTLSGWRSVSPCLPVLSY